MTCSKCLGAGVVDKTFLFIVRWTAKCPECDGKGWVADPQPQRELEFMPSRPSRVLSKSVPKPPSSTPKQSSDSNGDPLAAALVSGALGGDPLAAGVTTMLTGSTALGILAGGLGGHHQESPAQFEGDGGRSGGGGASADFQAPQDLPVIADPFPQSSMPEQCAPEVSISAETTCAVPDYTPDVASVDASTTSY
jgi:hypothetical protein